MSIIDDRLLNYLIKIYKWLTIYWPTTIAKLLICILFVISALILKLFTNKI